MTEQIEKKLKGAKTCGYIALASLAVMFIGIAMSAIPLILIPVYVFLIFGIIFLVKRGSIVSNQKWLQKRNLGHIVNTFSENDPFYPKSKIRCGHMGLMHTKSMVMVPYSEIAWIYQHVTKAYGITTGRQIMICCQDGKSFAFPSVEAELTDILQKHILQANSRIIIGFDAQRQKAYRTIVKNYKSQH